MNVVIIERATGKAVATYPIVLVGQNYSPTSDEYFREAWKCAIEDNLAGPADFEKYDFRLYP